MSGPRHVRLGPLAQLRSYSSPDATPRRWRPNRRGDLAFGQPAGALRGHQGPDQGYAFTLVSLFDERLVLAEGEDRHDVDAGCVAVALKRASIFGRAPVVWDLEAAYTVFGYLDPHPPTELAQRRAALFEGASESHNYGALRALTACVPAEVLSLAPGEITRRYHADPVGLTRSPGPSRDARSA